MKARQIIEFERRMRERPSVSSDLAAVLPYPHYTDPRWNTARLIWGEQQKTAECNYSDRLWQWDSEAADRASRACTRMEHNTARWVQAWLSAYHGKPVALRYIMAGCNVSSGYAYYVYGYDYVDSVPVVGTGEPTP